VEKNLIMKLNETPWTEKVHENDNYVVFKDGFPVTQGHLLFVPTENTRANIALCWAAAYEWGTQMVENLECDGFNLGQNIGRAAGQTVMYPHVHLIPRRFGDMPDPRGGVRHVIPEKGNYKK